MAAKNKNDRHDDHLQGLRTSLDPCARTRARPALRRSTRRLPAAAHKLVAVSALLWAIHAPAADPPADPEPEKLTRIEVTGSRIPRIDAETSLPVQVITRDEILRANWTTAAELLANVPANTNGANLQTSLFDARHPGLESANLRGLGDGNTLVLLNGRRLANYAFLSGTVNLSAIPLAAIDRVEVLKDGASSVYGSDAVAGVVNFITRKDYTGLDVVGQAGVTERGGGDHYQATVSAGWGNLARDRVNAFVTFDWQKDTALSAADRPFATNSYRPDDGIYGLLTTSYPANIRVSSSRFLNPTYPSGCKPPLSLPFNNLQTASGDLSGQICAFDFAQTSTILPDAERWSVLARATWQVAPEHQVFAEYLYNRTQTTLAISPTPISRDENGVGVSYPANGPYYPTDYAAANGLSGPLRIYYRTVELGPRTDVATADAQRLVVGAQGALGEWNYGSGVSYSVNTGVDDYTKGYLSWTRLRSAMATGLVNPWGPNTQAGLDLLSAAQFIGVVRDAKGTTTQVDFQANREWLPLPGGPLALAIGGEWRREALSDNPNPILDTGDVVGIRGEVSPQDASRTVGALFAELNLPLATGFEVLASVRYDHYSDFGGTTNPKVGVRWQPVKSLLFRAAWGTGFRAPTLVDLYEPQFTVLTEGLPPDPFRCPVTGSDQDCGGAYGVVTGGNPNLQPETSTQSTAGVVWAPAPGWSFGAQWWRIEKNNVITALGAADVFDQFDALSSTNVIRGPVDPAHPGLPGPIEKIITYNQNLGSLTTSGVDFSANAQLPEFGLGTWSLSFAGTYVYQFLEDIPGFGPYSYVGQIGFYGAVPRWRHYAALNGQYGAWGASLSQSFQSGLVDAQSTSSGELRRVGTYTLWNLQGTYNGFTNTSIAVGVRNLFNTDPPFSNANNFGYFPGFADVHGRTYYGRISYAFR
jgi:iron complex outermembrane receptor protein